MKKAIPNSKRRTRKLPRNVYSVFCGPSFFSISFHIRYDSRFTYMLMNDLSTCKYFYSRFSRLYLRHGISTIYDSPPLLISHEARIVLVWSRCCTFFSLFFFFFLFFQIAAVNAGCMLNMYEHSCKQCKGLGSCGE